MEKLFCPCLEPTLTNEHVVRLSPAALLNTLLLLKEIFQAEGWQSILFYLELYTIEVTWLDIFLVVLVVLSVNFLKTIFTVILKPPRL